MNEKMHDDLTVKVYTPHSDHQRLQISDMTNGVMMKVDLWLTQEIYCDKSVLVMMMIRLVIFDRGGDDDDEKKSDETLMRMSEDEVLIVVRLN